MGSVEIDGKPLKLGSPTRAIAAGLGFVPEDRRREGLVIDHGIAINIALPSLMKLRVSNGRFPILMPNSADGLFDHMRSQLKIVCRAGRQHARELSGGNQQKVVVAKWLATNARLLILDEPTAGVDVNAKEEMRLIIRDAASRGMAVLLIASEMEELTRVADRIVTMVDGTLGRTLPSGATETELRAALQVDLEEMREGTDLVTDNDHSIRSVSVARAVLLQLFRPGPHVTYIVFLLIIGFFLIFAPNFATWGAAGAIGRITAVVTIMAVGMTFVIVCGEIDLSVGSHASFAAMIVAMLLYNDVPGALAAPAVLLLGAAVGALNGVLVTKLRIPSFLVSLGMLSVLRGLALSFTGSLPVPIVDRDFVEVLAGGIFLSVPVPIWWTLITALIGFYLLHMSGFRSACIGHRRKHGCRPIFGGQHRFGCHRRLRALWYHRGIGWPRTLRSKRRWQPDPGLRPRARCHRRRHNRRDEPVWRSRLHTRLGRRRDFHRHSRLRPHCHESIDEYSGSH